MKSNVKIDLDGTLGGLNATLNNFFLKRLQKWRDEFTILKAEMIQIKRVLKTNFGIEISLQNPPLARKR